MQIIQRWAPWVTGLLLAVAGWLTALLCWELVGLATADRTPINFAPPPATKIHDSSPTYDLNAVVSVPLFGEANKAVIAPVVSDEVKRSNLRINLLGVVAGGDQGVAILKHDGKEYAYKVGDRLDVSETITLAAVEAEYVIISRAGGNEKIELEQSRRSGTNDIRVVQRGGGQRTQNINLNDPSIRRLVGDPRQTLNNNPLRLTRYISANPYVQGGKTVGFQVQAGRDKRLFGQLGLQGGDVVTSINGLRVGEAPVSDLLNSVNSSQTVEVEILRNGLPQTIRLNL
ncbi:type II secretion system protein GspC [Litorivivens sp.]|uniref:type II secretion system protein GspC n=1 Tax=Litorivivens sp. TaxID=2020868 RepID=UPI0035664E97